WTLRWKRGKFNKDAAHRAACPTARSGPHTSKVMRELRDCQYSPVAFARDSHHFEMSAAQQRPRADKRTRGKIAGELLAIRRVELVVEREVGAEHRYLH